MGRVTEEVRALLPERQDRRKAELDTARRDAQFDVGDEVDTEHTQHTPLSSRSRLSPRWMGPFRVLARMAHMYRLDILATWRVFPAFNVVRLQPAPLAGAAGAPSPIPPAGFTVDAAPPGDLGVARVGRTVL